MKYLTLILTVLTLALAAVPATAQGIDPYGCDDVAAYQRALVATLPDPETPAERRAMAKLFDDDTEFTDLRPSELRAASAYLDRWAGNLEDVPVSAIPRVATDYHAGVTDVIGLLASMLNAMATGGPFGALAYVDPIEAALADVTAEGQWAATVCGADWTDSFPASGGALPMSDQRM